MNIYFKCILYLQFNKENPKQLILPACPENRSTSTGHMQPPALFPLPSPNLQTNYKLRVGREGHQLLIFTASNFLDESTPVCPSVYPSKCLSIYKDRIKLVILSL